ncbi:MAG: J domain-containing protein [Litorimonas sp.]
MAKNPYTLLGVKKTSSDAEIRKAYRTLAKKLHPDVNPGNKAAEEKFKNATAAYNLLSDKKLRKQYDSGQIDSSGQQQNPFGGAGFGGAHRGRAGGHDDMSDLFSSLFGMNSANMRGGMQPRPAKGGDILYKLTIDLPEALTGGMRTIDKGLSLKLPKGVKDGQVLRLKGKGQVGQYGGPNGDAKVEIKLRKHKYLTRKNDDLHLILPISLHEALNGAKVKIDMPNGAVSLNLPAGTNSGKKLRLKGKGVGVGDLVVSPVITLSDSELSKKSEILEKIPENSSKALRLNMF